MRRLQRLNRLGLFAFAAAIACARPVLADKSAVPAGIVHTDHIDPLVPFFVCAAGLPECPPGIRGPGGQVLFDSISGCSFFSRYSAAPAAILDDLSFAPGPAAGAGGVVTSMDFFIRSWGPLPRITVRLTFYDTVLPGGQGSPLVVQHDMVSRQFVVIENAPVNINGPGSYLISTQLIPFALLDASFGLEIAFVDEQGDILPNGALSTVFPAAVCASSQPVIGSSQEIFWIDNDLGDLTGDGIRYEPAAPTMPNDQGDALVWGGAQPADNVLAIRLRGSPIEPMLGACCMSVEPFACSVGTPQDCLQSGGEFVGLGVPCVPVFACVPPAANDECGQAQRISGEGLFPFDTRGASSSGPDDCRTGLPPFSISSDVWFSWDAPCGGEFTFATCDQSVTDDRVSVYAGDCAEPLSLGCDDNACPGGFQSRLAVEVVANQTYLIRIGVFPNTPGGQGQLLISRTDGECAPPCEADFDGDGLVATQDIFAFLAAWFTGVPRAWFFGGTAGGVPSIFAFLSVWFADDLGPC